MTNAAGGSATFAKPSDNIGVKTIPDYAAYAAQHVYSVNIPGCSTPGKVFVGQRKDPFAVNLGVIFDLVNVPGAADFSPAEAAFLLDPALKDAGGDDLRFKNVTALALEVPTSCLLAAGGADPVIGGWTTASLRQGRCSATRPRAATHTVGDPGGAWTQVSRLGHPLVNEVVIGLPDKDKFNNSKPKDDGQFATYVTNPTLPALVEIALATPNIAPTNFPRTDLVTTFLTGIPGVTQPKAFSNAGDRRRSEMLRLNTAIAATPEASQNRLGLLGGLLAGPGGDLAGYPNGRRPNDDVVDISLVAVMGGLCVANGAADTYKLGAACNPTQRAARRARRSTCTTASTRPARRSRPRARCCRPSRTSARRSPARAERSQPCEPKQPWRRCRPRRSLAACGGGGDDDTPPADQRGAGQRQRLDRRLRRLPEEAGRVVGRHARAGRHGRGHRPDRRDQRTADVD